MKPLFGVSKLISILIAFWTGVVTLLFFWSKDTFTGANFGAPLAGYFLMAMFCVPFLMIFISGATNGRGAYVLLSRIMRMIFNVAWIAIGLTFIFADGNSVLLTVSVSVAILSMIVLLMGNVIYQVRTKEAADLKIMGLKPPQIAVLLSFTFLLIALYWLMIPVAGYYRVNKIAEVIAGVVFYVSGALSLLSLIYVIRYSVATKPELRIRLSLAFLGVIFAVNFIFVSFLVFAMWVLGGF